MFHDLPFDDLPTDEMLINWREANDYTHEAPEDDEDSYWNEVDQGWKVWAICVQCKTFTDVNLSDGLCAECARPPYPEAYSIGEYVQEPLPFTYHS